MSVSGRKIHPLPLRRKLTHAHRLKPFYLLQLPLCRFATTFGPWVFLLSLSLPSAP